MLLWLPFYNLAELDSKDMNLQLHSAQERFIKSSVKTALESEVALIFHTGKISFQYWQSALDIVKTRKHLIPAQLKKTAMVVFDKLLRTVLYTVRSPKFRKCQLFDCICDNETSRSKRGVHTYNKRQNCIDTSIYQTISRFTVLEGRSICLLSKFLCLWSRKHSITIS